MKIFNLLFAFLVFSICIFLLFCSIILCWPDASKADNLKGVNFGLKEPIDNSIAFVEAGGKLVRWQVWSLETLQNAIDDKIIPYKVISWMGNPRDSSILFDAVRQLKGVPGIYGYELGNEPGYSNSKLRRIYRGYEKQIHAIDSDANIVVEPKNSLPKYLSKFRPIEGIETYSIHLYAPLSYTHQGIRDFPFPVPFDAKVGRILVDDLNRIKDWQNKYHKKVFIGEFGCARTAPSCAFWLKFLTDFANREGWDWSVIGWRDSDVWNYELDPIEIGVLKEAWK